MTSTPPPHRRLRPLPLLLTVLGLTATAAGCSAPGNVAAADTTPRAGTTTSGSPFLTEVARQIALPAHAWTASGTHKARGYTTKAATTTDTRGMKADCDNINLNRKLAADFRADVFGPGLKGFFPKCRKISADTNEYWFTVSSADRAQIDKLCDPATTYPIVHDVQHGTYWIDEPFSCTDKIGPS